MSYSRGHPIRLVGGRLALDFVNTADWSADGEVVHEKLANAADLRLWLTALGLKGVRPIADVADLIGFRVGLRRLLLGGRTLGLLNAVHGIEIADGTRRPSVVAGQPLKSIIAVSAFSILADQRERDRRKMCPGDNCGWLFLDETKNARRRWCSMQSCGNRAKAARHYARRKDARS